MKQIKSQSFAGRQRLSVSEAKAKLSEVLRSLHEAPVTIHNRGRDIAVIIDVSQYQPQPEDCAGAVFLSALQQLKKQFGGGAEFEPRPARITPKNPFAHAGRSRARAG